MRKIIIILSLIFFCLNAESQSWQISGIKARYVVGLGVPAKDTFSIGVGDSAQLVIRPQDSTLYTIYKGNWRKAGVGTLDTLKMFGNYYTKSQVDAKTISGITLGNSLYQLNFGYGFGSIIPYNGSGTVNQTIDSTVLVSKPYFSNFWNSLNTANWDTAYRWGDWHITVATKLNISDTAAMLSSYYNKTNTDAKLNLKVNYTDTASALASYKTGIIALNADSVYQASQIAAQQTAINALNADTATIQPRLNNVLGVANSKQNQLNGTGYVKMSGTTPSYISAIPNTDLVNSTISGVALGGNLNNLSLGYGLSGLAYNGSAVQTWKVDTTVIVSKAGTIMTGYLTLNADPTNSYHAATKNYVDNLVTGLTWKSSVRVATTANIILSGLQTIDGIAISASDRVLVKNQTAGTDNGIYIASASAWARSSDMTTGAQVWGSAVYIESGGTLNGGTQWTNSNTSQPVIGTTAITFSQIAGAGVYTNGTYLSLTGNVFDVASTYSSNWNTAYTNRITSLTTTGTSGAATLVSNVLNIPQYQAAYTNLTSMGSLANGSGVLVNNGTGGFSYTTTPSITATQISNSLTFNNSGTGAVSGTTFNGSAAQTISYNTIGASPLAGSSSITTLGTITTGVWNGTAIADSYIASSATWNAKQAALSGTGFVKISGTTISYDNNNYYLASNPSGYISGITASMVNAVGTISNNTTGSAGSVANALTIGTDLSGTSYNGSAAVTINNTSTLQTVAGRGNTFNGNIGLGGTGTPAWGNLYNGVSLTQSGTAVFGRTNNELLVTTNMYYNGTNWIVANSATATPNLLLFGNNNFGLYTATTGAIGATTALTNTFVINVGTGTITTGIWNAGAVTSSGTITGTSFSGAGTGLTDIASGLSIGGNAATATTWANVTGDLNSLTASASINSLVVKNNSNNAGVANLSNIQTWLGLGSNAYTSTAYLPLTGGTLTGALSGTSATFSSSVTSGGLNTIQYSNGSSYAGMFITNLAPSALNNSSDIFFGTWSSAAITNIYNARISALNTNAGTAATDLLFYTYNGSGLSSGVLERLRINSAGNVLIGTTTGNGSKLQVSGAATFSSSVTATSFIGAGSGLTSLPTNPALYPTLNQSTTGSAGSVANALTIGTDLSGTSYNGSAAVTINNTSTLQTVAGRGNSTATGISLTQNGNLSTSYALYGKRNRNTSPLGYLIQFQDTAATTNLFTVDVNGAVTATGFFNSSSILKKNISKRYSSADGIDIVNYTWKPEFNMDTKKHIGVIAQEVEEIMPDAVEGYYEVDKRVNYIEVLLYKIQKLEERIKRIETK